MPTFADDGRWVGDSFVFHKPHEFTDYDGKVYTLKRLDLGRLDLGRLDLGRLVVPGRFTREEVIASMISAIPLTGRQSAKKPS